MRITLRDFRDRPLRLTIPWMIPSVMIFLTWVLKTYPGIIPWVLRIQTARSWRRLLLKIIRILILVTVFFFLGCGEIFTFAVGQKKKKRKNKTETESKLSGPILANTTITVLRHCGKYLQMCRLLKPIALDVILCMCQLYDYYLFNVFQFFTADLVSFFWYLGRFFFNLNFLGD